jgi:hypothetical protein
MQTATPTIKMFLTILFTEDSFLICISPPAVDFRTGLRPGNGVILAFSCSMSA